MRKIIFKQSNGWQAHINTVFKDIPELETILEEWNFNSEMPIDEFIDFLNQYLIINTDIIEPMAIITDKIFGVSIKHCGIKYYLIIKEVEGGE